MASLAWLAFQKQVSTKGGMALGIAGHALISSGEKWAYALILPLIGGIAMEFVDGGFAQV
jgi:hypothetical protein